MDTPGAEISGFIANAPPQPEGPRLEKPAIVYGGLALVAPTEKQL
jgi:hypothetical protein